MGWFRNLKGWQKAGVIVGGIYFSLFLFVFLVVTLGPQEETGMGYLLLFMTWPWAGIFIFFGIGPSAMGNVFLMGMFSASLNGVVAMFLFYLFSLVKK